MFIDCRSEYTARASDPATGNVVMFFGTSEDEKVLPHVGKALGLKGSPS